MDIEEQHTRPDQCRNAVLQLWLEKYPISADWVDLADALQHMPQHVGKSNTIRSKYCKYNHKNNSNYIITTAPFKARPVK